MYEFGVDRIAHALCSILKSISVSCKDLHGYKMSKI